MAWHDDFLLPLVDDICYVGGGQYGDLIRAIWMILYLARRLAVGTCM